MQKKYRDARKRSNDSTIRSHNVSTVCLDGKLILCAAKKMNEIVSTWWQHVRCVQISCVVKHIHAQVHVNMCPPSWGRDIPWVFEKLLQKLLIFEVVCEIRGDLPNFRFFFGKMEKMQP
jgi:hypothetical protein